MTEQHVLDRKRLGNLVFNLSGRRDQIYAWLRLKQNEKPCHEDICTIRLLVEYDGDSNDKKAWGRFLSNLNEQGND